MEEALQLSRKKRAEGCVLCGSPGPLLFHHIIPKDKRFAVPFGLVNLSERREEEVITEIHKCICLCRSCHWLVHNWDGRQSGRLVKRVRDYLGDLRLLEEYCAFAGAGP